VVETATVDVVDGPGSVVAGLGSVEVVTEADVVVVSGSSGLHPASSVRVTARTSGT
jgi:hypothetical protein